jgi:hypothetical protein
MQRPSPGTWKPIGAWLRKVSIASLHGCDATDAEFDMSKFRKYHQCSKGQHYLTGYDLNTNKRSATPKSPKAEIEKWLMKYS